MVKLKFAVLIITILSSSLLSACYGDGEFVEARKINVISREDGSGTRRAFIEMLGIEVTDDAGTRDLTSTKAVVAPGTSQVITAISGDLYAIGYISLGTLSDSVRAVAMDGVAASPENVLNGTYPLFRAFEIVVGDDISLLAQDFIDFILSAQGQAVVSGRGYVVVDESAPQYVPSVTLRGTIDVIGSSSVTPLMERLKEAYEKLNPDASIQIQMSGSSAGIAAAISGTADIGMTSRPLRETEAAQLQNIHIAYDGLVVIVNPNNPLESLSQDEVRSIFIGELTEWNALFKQEE